MTKISDLEGKKVLEFGCGDGWFTRLLATKGAHVWTFDISSEAVKLTADRMRQLGFQDRVHVQEMSAEDLSYDPDTFDVVLGNAILHHVDLSIVLRKTERILKKGGRAYFMEPLGHNPFLNFYRFLTPNLQSKDEQPLLFDQFDEMEQIFSEFEHQEYYLSAIFALGWYFVGAKSLMLNTRDVLSRLDERLLAWAPSLRKYCWYTILSLKK